MVDGWKGRMGLSEKLGHIDEEDSEDNGEGG
jgi:hypothetical protein